MGAILSAATVTSKLLGEPDPLILLPLLLRLSSPLPLFSLPAASLLLLVLLPPLHLPTPLSSLLVLVVVVVEIALLPTAVSIVAPSLPRVMSVRAACAATASSCMCGDVGLGLL